jgi:hypothetical protein
MNRANFRSAVPTAVSPAAALPPFVPVQRSAINSSFGNGPSNHKPGSNERGHRIPVTASLGRARLGATCSAVAKFNLTRLCDASGPPPSAVRARLKFSDLRHAVFEIIAACFFCLFVLLMFCAVVGAVLGLLFFKL